MSRLTTVFETVDNGGVGIIGQMIDYDLREDELMSTPIRAEVFPAGEHLAEEIAARGWTQDHFAEILGKPPQLVFEIISGKKEVARDVAAQIGAALGTSIEFWLNLQDSYLLWKQSPDAQVS